MKRLTLIMVTMLITCTALAQVNRARTVFHFPQLSTMVDPEYDGNVAQMQVLDSIAYDFSRVADTDRYLIISSYSTPDEVGNASNLALERAKAAHRIFDTKLHALGSSDAHAIYKEGTRSWYDVLTAVKNDNDIPAKEEVIRVMEETMARGYSNYTSAMMVSQIKSVNDGKSYQYIYDHIFPEMRGAEIVVSYVNNPRLVTPKPIPVVEVAEEEVVVPPVVVEEPAPVVEEVAPVVEEVTPVTEEVTPVQEVIVPVVPVQEEAVPVKEDEPVVPVQEEVEPVVPVQEEPIKTEEIQPEIQENPLQQETQQQKEFEEIQQPLQRTDSLLLKSSGFWKNIALKTNLLYDVALVPNVGLEVSLSNHLSVAANWMYAWWSIDTKHYYWRIYGGDLEMKYWLKGSDKTGRKFTGHHIGAYCGILTYDFETGGRGYQGKRWSHMAGLSYGYAIPISSRLNFDFNLGIGYLGGEYYEYDYNDVARRYIWQQTKKRHWFGPTKAEVSLVWLLGKQDNNK